MLSRVMFACVVTFGLATTSLAGPIGPEAETAPAFLYSPGASPFETFTWTPLDFAAFSAYGGDFANVRRPVTPVVFDFDPFTPPLPAGPEDEQDASRLLSPVGFNASVPFQQVLDVTPENDEPGSEDDAAVPEPAVLALIGAGMVGISVRLRRSLRARTE